MKKKNVKRFIAILVLIVSVVASLVVYGETVKCDYCKKSEGVSISNTTDYGYNTKYHFKDVIYWVNCPRCGKHKLITCIIKNTMEEHTIKTTKKSYPKKNLRVITKGCTNSHCGYVKSETYEPIDPKKPWVTPK